MKNNKRRKKLDDSNFRLIKLIKKNSFPILIVILILCTLTLIGVNIFYGNSVNIEDKEITELYSYISNDNINKCEGLIFYTDKKVTKDDLTDSQKVCLAFLKTNDKKSEKVIINKDKKNKTCTLDKSKGMKFATDNYEKEKCTIQKYDSSIFASKYETIFNEKISKIDSFVLDGSNICYLKDNYYYCGLSETFSFTIGNESFAYRIINKATEKGKDEIIIYDYFIKINNDKCYSSFTSLNEIKKCSKKYDSDEKINYKFIKKYGTKYKHVFKKINNNNYYSWISSEPLN